MKKQKLSLNLSLALIIIASAINAMAIKVNAGETNTLGSTEESTSFSGDNFNPGIQTTPTLELTPDAKDSIELNNGQLTISAAYQERLNQIVSEIISNSSSTGGDETQINAVISLLRRSNPIQARDAVEKSLTENGISKSDAVQLINSVESLFAGFDSASTRGIPVASNKSLITSSFLAQNSSQNVDINKLNTAVNAYNKIIMKSDAKTLKKIAVNPEFMEIRNILNQLRTALKN
ncbi:MAG: hypothetical protein IGS23_17550 [Rivularia sp. T60_A2020_040]|nr:hypothetical protein [Rivularia sp. T60_A2020_040]